MYEEQIIELYGEKFKVISGPIQKEQVVPCPGAYFSHYVRLKKLPPLKPMPKIEPGDVVKFKVLSSFKKRIVVKVKDDRIFFFDNNDPWGGLLNWGTDDVVAVYKQSGETWKREEC